MLKDFYVVNILVIPKVCFAQFSRCCAKCSWNYCMNMIDKNCISIIIMISFKFEVIDFIVIQYRYIYFERNVYPRDQ